MIEISKEVFEKKKKESKIFSVIRYSFISENPYLEIDRQWYSLQKLYINILIEDVINYTNIEIVQLHGNEDMNYINNLLKILNKEIKIWKAVEVIDYKSIQKIKN